MSSTTHEQFNYTRGLSTIKVDSTMRSLMAVFLLLTYSSNFKFLASDVVIRPLVFVTKLFFLIDVMPILLHRIYVITNRVIIHLPLEEN